MAAFKFTGKSHYRIMNQEVILESIETAIELYDS